MTIQTYADLQTEIKRWLHRPGDTELAASIPTLIQFAESRINNELRTGKMVRYRSVSVAGNSFDRPADFLEMVTIGPKDDPGCELELVGPREIRQAIRNHLNQYAYVGDQIMIGRANDTEPQNIDMVYYARIPCLCDAEQSWLLSEQPDIYLFGALTFSAPFLKDDARIATWEAGYQAAKGGYQGTDDRGRWSGQTPMVGMPR